MIALAGIALILIGILILTIVLTFKVCELEDRIEEQERRYCFGPEEVEE